MTCIINSANSYELLHTVEGQRQMMEMTMVRMKYVSASRMWWAPQQTMRLGRLHFCYTEQWAVPPSMITMCLELWLQIAMRLVLRLHETTMYGVAEHHANPILPACILQHMKSCVNEVFAEFIVHVTVQCSASGQCAPHGIGLGIGHTCGVAKWYADPIL